MSEDRLAYGSQKGAAVEVDKDSLLFQIEALGKEVDVLINISQNLLGSIEPIMIQVEEKPSEPKVGEEAPRTKISAGLQSIRIRVVSVCKALEAGRCRIRL